MRADTREGEGGVVWCGVVWCGPINHEADEEWRWRCCKQALVHIQNYTNTPTFVIYLGGVELRFGGVDGLRGETPVWLLVS